MRDYNAWRYGRRSAILRNVSNGQRKQVIKTLSQQVRASSLEAQQKKKLVEDMKQYTDDRRSDLAIWAAVDALESVEA